MNHSSLLRTAVFTLAVAGFCQPQTLGYYPNKIKDAEDAAFSRAAPLAKTGVATWHVSEPYINLWIHDQPLTYMPSHGQPIAFQVAFKQRNHRSTANVFGLGPGWESSWLSYVEFSQNGTNVTAGTNYVRLGGARLYSPTNSMFDFKTASQMSNLFDGETFLGFQIEYPSGAKQTFDYIANTNAFLTEEIDAVCRTNRFEYGLTNGVVYLLRMVDSDNRTNTLGYDTTYTTQIGEVEDPYGRKAQFSYDGNGRLASIVNVGGLTNSFAYNVQGLITNLTTVYGTNSFATTTNQVSEEVLGGSNQINRSVLITEPEGEKQLFFYRDHASKLNSISGTDLLPTHDYSYPPTYTPSPPNLSNTFGKSYVYTRNSFHWDRTQFDNLNATFKSSLNFYDLTVSDYQKARCRNWLRRYNNEDVVTDTISLEQSPSSVYGEWGQKIWYDYGGKTNGNWTRGTNAFNRFVAWRLPNAQTHYNYTERNQRQKPTRIVDTYTSGASTAARTNDFEYAANGIDLIKRIGPSNELVSSNAYNGFHQVVTNFNAMGYRTEYTYDADHRLTEIKWPTGLRTANSFYTSGTNIGWIEKTIDYDETETPIRTNTISSYDKGLVAASTDVHGVTTTREWDDLQRPEKAIYGGFATNTYQYEKLRLKIKIDPVNTTNTFTYDDLARIATVSDARSTNSFEYTSDLLSASTNALSEVEQYDHDLDGRLLKVTYPDTAFSQQRFNILGQLTNQVDVVGSFRNYFYNNQGLLIASSNAFGQYLLRQYDNHDRLTNEVDSRGVSVSFTYDDLGRVLRRSHPDGGIEQFEYSPRGLISYTNQLGHVTRYGYDALGRRIAVTNANNEVVRYAYNAAGNVTSLSDGKNQTVTFGYDAYGRLTSKTNAAGVEILRFEYDAAGRVTNRWTKAKGNTVYAYDEVGNLTNINYPASPDVTFDYDALKRLTSMRDAYSALGSTNAQTTFTYNNAGVLENEGGLDGTNSVAYLYWTNDVRKQFVVQQRDGTYWTNLYYYDAAVRLQYVETPSGFFTNVYSPGVSPSMVSGSSLLEKTLYPNGAYVTNAFDNAGRLAFTKLMSSSNALLNAHIYTNNVASQRTRQTRADGSYVDYTYDNIGQLLTALGKESGGTTNRLNEQLSYGYDGAWNLQYRTNNALVQEISANSLNRATSVSRSGTFTLAGNTTIPATNVTVNGAAAIRYADDTYVKDGLTLTNGANSFSVVAHDSEGYGDTNVIAGNFPTTVNFTFDDNGNLTSDGLRGFDYDDENRLTRITVTNAWKTEFIYDGIGRRRVRNEYLWFDGAWGWNLSIEYIYDGNVVVQERWGGDEPWVNYTRGLDLSGTWHGAGGIGGLLAHSQRVSGTYRNHYYHSDGNGNVTALVSENQVISARYLYDPYGNLLASSGGMADVNAYRFSSQEFHAKSGLYAYAMRFYEPRLGRWLNGDPLREGGGINLYGFVGNDPINGVDPHGTFALLVAPLVVAAGEAVLTWEGIGLGAAATAALTMTLVDTGEFIDLPSATLTQFQPGPKFGFSRPEPRTDSDTEDPVAPGPDPDWDDSDDPAIIYHYTSAEAALQIYLEGAIIASDKKRFLGDTFPSGAYATDIAPYDKTYTQREVSALFYGGSQHEDMSWFVAIEMNDFTPLSVPGYPHQYIKYAAPGERVPVKVVGFGQNTMDP